MFRRVLVIRLLYHRFASDKKTAWLNDYPPDAVRVFLEKNPGFKRREKKQALGVLIAAKLAACVIFTALLSWLAYLAGARDFWSAALYSYIIWFTVNLFDVVVLDLGIFAHWRKIRLPGTEDMDKVYASNRRKHLLDGLFGILIGIPVAALCGLMINILK